MAVYGRTKGGHNIYHCAARRKDGKPCGHRVQVHGGVCGQHRAMRERERRKRST